MDNIKLVASLISEDLRKKGMTERGIEELKGDIRETGGAHQVMVRLQGETKHLEQTIATLNKETKEIEARKSKLAHSVGQYRHSVRTLKPELTRLQRLKAKY